MWPGLGIALRVFSAVVPGYYSERSYNIGCDARKIANLALGVSFAAEHTHILAWRFRLACVFLFVCYVPIP